MLYFRLHIRNTRANWMMTHDSNFKQRSGNFAAAHRQNENIGITERMVSMFLGGILIGRNITNPFKAPFLYGAYLTYRAFTGRCLLYERLGINAKHPTAVNIRGEFEIERPQQEVYAYWQNPIHLPESIRQLMSGRWNNFFSKHWEAEIVKDEPGRLIGWRSLPGSAVSHVGKVTFEDSADGNSTLLKVVISYHPPAGGLGMSAAKLLNPYFEQLLKNDFRNFKYKIEK